MKHFYSFTNRVVKSFRALALMAFVLLSVGNVWGTTITVTTCDLTAKTANSTAYNSEWSYGDWTLFGAANNNGGWAFMKFGGKKTTLATSNPCWVKNATEIASPITKITVTTNEGNLAVGTVDVWGVLVYSDASRTTLIDSVVGGTMTKQVAESFDLLPTNGESWPASSYYTVFFKMSNSTTKNGIVWVEKVAFNYTSSCTSLATPTVTATPGNTQATLSWDPVANASSYTLVWNGGAAETVSSPVTKTGLTNGTSYSYSVMAVGDGSTYCSDNTAATGNVTPVAPSYTITESTNNATYGTVSRVGVVITGAPKPGYGYASPAYTVTSGTATVSQSGNDFTVTPTEDCAVQINFAALPTYTLTWNVNGSTSTTTVVQGNAIGTLPSDPTSCDGNKVFYGWSATNIGSTPTDNAPTLITTATVPSANTTYYAVFATASGSGSGGYELVTSAAGITAGTYAFGAMRSTSVTSAFYIGTSTVSSGDIVTSTTSVTPTSGVFTSLPTDASEFVLTGNNTDGFTISCGSTYLGYTDASSSRTLAWDASYNTITWTFDMRNTLTTGGVVMLSSGSYKVSENSTAVGALRGYASTGNYYRDFYLFKKSGGTTYSAFITSCCTAPTTPLALTSSEGTSLILSGGDAETTISVASGTGNGGAVTYAITAGDTDHCVLDDSTGEFVADATGTWTITATQALNGTTCGGTATIDITVSEASSTITYNANGGTGTMAAQTGTTGAAVTLTNNAFTRTGYNFTGWNTASDGSGTSYTNQQATTYQTMTLYAQWLIISRTVTSNLTGCTATGIPANVNFETTAITATVTADACYTLPTDITVTMGGTALTADYDYMWVASTGELWLMPGSDPVAFTGNIVITITATATPDRTVTFSTGLAGLDIAAASVACGSSTTLPTVNRDLLVCEQGKDFAGWSTHAAATSVEYAEGANYTPTRDVTLYGVWSEGTVTNNYTKLTSTSQLEAGADYLVVHTASNVAMKAATYSSGLDKSSVTISSNTITTSEAALIWRLGGTSNAWTLYNASTSKYLSLPSGDVTTLLALADTGTPFTISTTNITSNENSGTYKYVSYHTGSYYFNNYKDNYAVLFKRQASVTYSTTATCTLACTDALDLTAVMTASADAVNLNFDGIATATLAVSTSGTDAATDGTWAVSCSNASATSCSIDGTTVTLETATAGSYPVKAVFTPTNSAYCPRSVTTTITVLAKPTVTIVDVTPLAFTAACGVASGSQSVTVSGWNLTANVTATAPTGFQVSTDNDTYSSSVSFIKDANGKVDNQPLYVRVNAPAQSDVDLADTLRVTSTGAQAAKLAVSATVSCLEYTVTFEANGTTFDTYTGYAGTSVTFPVTNPTDACEGFAFDGWAAASVSDASTSYTKVTSLTTPSENKTLYAVYKACVKSVSDSWTLVTESSSLMTGDSIIIAASGSNSAMSTTQNTNNRGETTITKSGNTLTTPSASVQRVVLGVGTTANTWSFYDATATGYLYAASSSNNYLRTETSLTSNSSWTVSITSAGVATVTAEGSNTRNLLQYNATSFLFSCYSGAQSNGAVALYRKGGNSCSYTTTPACGPRIKGTKDIMVTSANGVMVKTITDLRVEATQLTSRDDVADYPNVTITATSLNSKFKLRAAGVSSTGATSINLATSYAAATLDSTINVLYTPTSAGVMDTGRIALRVYKTGGTTNYALDTITVIGRSLPATFVIAANTGSGWVALPNDLASAAATPVAAYPVTVDNASNPTKATYAPSNAVYAGAARSTTYKYQSGLRFKSNTEDRHLQASTNDTKVWLPATNSETNQTWVLEAADFIDYAVHLDTTETTARRLQLSSGNIGHYIGTGTLRLLPIEEECRYFPAPVVEVDSKTSTTVTLTFGALEGATGYQISTDSTTWAAHASSTVDDVVTLTISDLTAATSYTYYVRGVDSGSTLTACSEGGKVTFTTTNCDSAPNVTVTSIAVTANNCGTLTFGYTGLVITTESATCPFTKFGIVMDTVNTFNKNPQFIEFGTTTLTASADTTITIAKAGTYYFAAYATNEVGTTITAWKTSVDVEGLSGLAILFKDNNSTAPMIDGTANLRVGYSTNSPAPIVWTLTNPSGVVVPNTIGTTGLFVGTQMGVYTLEAAQSATGIYCADTTVAFIEVRYPFHYGYVTNCAYLNNHDIEVVEIDYDSIVLNLDNINTDSVKIEFFKQNSGTGEVEQTVANDLFFSKYFEATGNLKLLGIFNGTKADIDITNVKIGVGAADVDGATAYASGASLQLFTNTSNQCIHLGSVGIPNNKILAGQEIILYTFGGAESNNTVETGTVRLDTCINQELQANTEDGLKIDERDNWYRLESDNTPKAGYLVWSGRQAIALWRLGAADNTLLDVIGSYHINATYGVYAGDSIRAKAAFGHEGDAPGWVSPNGVNYLTGATEVIGTNRALLIRKNTVVDGTKAVQLNLDGDFVTLGGTNGEWMGQSVGGGTGSGWEPNSKACEAFSSIAGFDYTEYFQRYDPITEKIDLSGTRNPDGTFTITTDGFAGTSYADTTFRDLACNLIQIKAYEKDSLFSSLGYKIPIIVKVNTTTDVDSIFNIEGQGTLICPDCDVVIRDNKTLTVVDNGYNSLRDIYVYSGAKLNVPNNSRYNARNIFIQSENNEVGYTLVNGNLMAEQGVVHTKRIDAKSWYDFTLPYACTVSSIVRTNGKTLGEYGTDWEILYYDGAKRAQTGTPNGATPTNWVQMPETATLQVGVGYLIGIGGKHNTNPTYKVRFQLPNLAGQVYTETGIENRFKSVIGHSGDAALRLPCHQGWNYIGNPFVSRFNGATQHGEVPWTTDLLLNGYYTDGLTGQTYDETFTDIYVAVQRGEGGATDWVQTKASEAELSPFRAFFIQAVGDGNVDFQKDSRDLPQAVLQRVANQDDVTSLLRLNLTGAATGSNYTELKLHSRFSMAYEVGHDMLRMMSYKTAPEPFILDSEGYYLIYSAADHKTAEESVIPVGFYASTSDTYTFSLSKAAGLSDYEAVYLKDNTLGITTNLLSSNYTFTSGRTRNTARFVLYLQKRQNITTDVTIVEGETPIAYPQGDAIVIENLPEGSTVRIIDAVGRVLLTTNEHSGIVRLHTPVSGAYMIQVLTPKENYTIKTIL